MVAAAVAALVLALGAAPAARAQDADKCPGSPASMGHAYFSMEGTASTGCAQVRGEMLARVAGVANGTWRDPHNGGTYALVEDAGGLGPLTFTRRSANDRYTDKMKYTFVDAGGASCSIFACSESQGNSMADQSTNYCNLHNLVCSTAEGCCKILHDFTWTKTGESKSSFAGNDVGVCLGGSGGSGGGLAGEKQTSCLLEGGTTAPTTASTTGASTTAAVTTAAAATSTKNVETSRAAGGFGTDGASFAAFAAVAVGALATPTA